ncbi:chromate transporter [Amylibacter kogurei]|uniref:Chromate transporter n=1 Tax=Paramylibacter kogurei TaxID=1889778 RepID=A0A2G5K7Q1_9RHOB|nr:chromate efflux transporter [Amylibacter kogurei]PIB25043.1 chromate transporter [Amylibacter kogurei]
MSSTPTLRTASRVWTKIGLLSFGGPAAQIALMHREIVEQNQWLTERQFLNALNFSMLLPGPEAMQLATYAGWRLHGTIGGLIAGLMFVLPGAIVIAILATIYAYFGSVPLVSALFLGVKATVVIIVIEALLRVAKKALHQPLHWAIALAAFIGIFFLQIPYPLIVLLAALTGWAFLKNSDISEPVQPRQPLSKMLRTVVIWLAIWWLPVLALELVTEQSILTEIAYFFSKLAVVTFGGAYAVLAYMAQDVVAIKGWLHTGEMMDGLGLAETTPGPLILVTEFVGFFAGFREGGIGMAIMAAIVTLWVTFTPCFLWIFSGAPYIDWIGAQPRLHGALSAITAAVVGVILNLSIWFALHVFFDVVNTNTLGPITLLTPSLVSINWLVVTLAILCGVLLLKRHWNVVTVLGLSGALAVIASAVGLG